MTNYHVSWKRGNYKITKEGWEKASAVNIWTKKEAELLAKQFCHKSWWWEVRIHWIDWKIIDSDTVKPGNDPFPPKDKVH